MNEQLAELFGRCYEMQFVGLRYFNVYGPRQDPDGPYAAVIPRFFKACLAGEAPVIYGDGEQSRDFTFVSDAVAANLAAAEAAGSACGRAYNVAGGRRTTVNELARLVREAVGSGLAPRHVATRPGDVPHSLADLTRARDSLGWIPRVGLPDGLAMTKMHYHGAVRGCGASMGPTCGTR
jgi:UDP-N-acetylglucosamine 4-epimerase